MSMWSQRLWQGTQEKRKIYTTLSRSNDRLKTKILKFYFHTWKLVLKQMQWLVNKPNQYEVSSTFSSFLTNAFETLQWLIFSEENTIQLKFSRHRWTLKKACTVKDFNNVSGQTIWQMKYFSLLLQNFLSEALHFSCYTEMFIIFDLKTNKQKPFVHFQLLLSL